MFKVNQMWRLAVSSTVLVILCFCIVTGTPINACEMMGRADIWLIRTYWDFEFPRPLLPNFKFVGGIHCRPAKPLPEVPEGHFVLSKWLQWWGKKRICWFICTGMILLLLLGHGKVCAEFWRWRYCGLHFGVHDQEHHHWEGQYDRLGTCSDPTEGQRSMFNCQLELTWMTHKTQFYGFEHIRFQSLCIAQTSEFVYLS